MSWPKKQPEWSRGRSHEYCRPYWDGHMFVAVYLTACGYNYSKAGRAIGLSGTRTKQLVEKARRIVEAMDRRYASATPHSGKVWSK